MGFLAICTALYDYQPQSAGELEITEGELLYILEKSTEDDWWRAKKKAAGDDEDEPEGLIPNNYVADAKPTHNAKALYDYSRQTDEEVSFSEDAALEVFDTSDPDWTLVGVNGEYGFAPANYIELLTALAKVSSAASPTQMSMESSERQVPSTPSSPARSIQSPAANLARVLGGGLPSPAASRPAPTQQQLTPEASDGEREEAAPALPRRPPSQTISSPASQHAAYQEESGTGALPSPPYNRSAPRLDNESVPFPTPGGFHMYNVNEMVSAMGRRKKMPTTLGLNVATGTVMLSPEKSRDGPSQEWSADKLTHYSIEGKHVFLELVRPSKSLDLHAGSKDTAEEIVAMLGEIAGAVRAEGIKEVMAAASGSGTHKKGEVLYDFMAQGDDEVTVAVGDEVVILDDTQSEDWWNVRRLKNGKEGVVPSKYIEITGTITAEPPSRSGVNAGRSTVEQNRLEEERLAKEAARTNRSRDAEEPNSRAQVGPGMQLPQRGSSLGDEDSRRAARREKRSARSDGKPRSKPDPSKTRTWTDHSGTFKVEAQFIGVADGKIHLHKSNGVKIAVPLSKMSPEDLEYVEKVTNESIEEHIPVADLIKMRRKNNAAEPPKSSSGASVDANRPQPPPKDSDYDWFDFFLKAGVGPHQCDRYAQAMTRDSMDESVLPDITQDTLRTLGLKEGDALKVMKYLDQKFGRTKGAPATNGDGATGGIFSGPGGALHNNTSRGRPEANRVTSDVVDASAFNKTEKPPTDAQETPLTKAPARQPQDGFDDDAWTIQPSKQPPRPAAASPPPALAPTARPPTGAMADLSLLDKPLEPTPAQPPRSAVQQQVSPQPPAPAPVAASAPPPQPGANPSFFAQLNQQPSGMQPQSTGFQQMPQINAPRQRPQAPPQPFAGSGLLQPPPRPTSAPQNAQPNNFGLGPLQPQLTGIPRTSALQAPPGQSLDELTQQRLQQQYNQMQMQQQQTGFQPNQGFGMVPQPTGFQPQQFGQFQQPYLNGNAAGSPFADPRPSFQPQPTGFGSFPQGPPPGGINSVLPPALQPQRTGFTSPLQQSQTANGFAQGFQPQPTSFQQPVQPQMTGYQQPMMPQQTGFGQQQNGLGGFQPPPVPPIPQQISASPLLPQKTGPAPDIRFGISDVKKLAPQPTGRRANLAAATPQNPFGF